MFICNTFSSSARDTIPTFTILQLLPFTPLIKQTPYPQSSKKFWLTFLGHSRIIRISSALSVSVLKMKLLHNLIPQHNLKLIMEETAERKIKKRQKSNLVLQNKKANIL